MARQRVMQNAFTGGEISPELAGRTDLDFYAKSARSIKNAIVLKRGGVTRRPGTRFVKEVKTSASATRLITFHGPPGGLGDYVIEMGSTYMRFYQAGVRIESPPGTPVEISTPYLSTHLFQIMFRQIGDVMYLAHRSYAPRKLVRTSTTSWALSEVDTIDGPYLPENTGVITITNSAATGTNIDLTASAPLWSSGHVGSVWRIKVGGNPYGYVKIVLFTSSTAVKADVKETLTATGATAVWREGAWSGVRGYPGAVSMFQQRTVWGGSDYQPNTIWASKVGQYEVFDPGTPLADDPYTYTLDDEVGDIRWLAASDTLLCGTAGREWMIQGGTDEPVTPLNILARPQTPHGSSRTMPASCHRAVLFIQRAERELREMSFDFGSNGYNAPDLAIRAEHITDPFLDHVAYQKAPLSIVWGVRSDGAMCSMTYERPNDVVAWHRHFTGFEQDGSDGKFESATHALRFGPVRDEIWVIVNRTIGGATKRYVEYLDAANGYYGQLHTDSAVLYSGSAVDTITGLSHLEGQTVDILGDGLVYPQQVVTGGEVTGLDPAVTQAEVGIPFQSEIIPMPFEMESGSGVGQTARKRWSTIFVRVKDTAGFTINETQTQTRISELGGTPELITEDVEVQNLGWSREGLITIQQNQPLPLTVLAVIGILNQED